MQFLRTVIYLFNQEKYIEIKNSFRASWPRWTAAQFTGFNDGMYLSAKHLQPEIYLQLIKNFVNLFLTELQKKHFYKLQLRMSGGCIG